MNILNQGRLMKSLALILVLALFIAMPLSGVRVNAETPTPIEIDNTEELETLSDVVHTDEGDNFEGLETVAEVVYSEDIINSVELVLPLLEEVSVIKVGSAEELETALDSFKSGDTIELTNNVEYSKGILIDGKTITFDVGNFTLDVQNSAGIGLYVENGGNVNLVGLGNLNVTGTSGGVKVKGNSSATVTNVTSNSGNGIGVYADGDGASIRVLGNVEAKGSSGEGIHTWRGGRVVVEGTVTIGAVYVKIGVTSLQKNEGVHDPEKPGYLKYISDSDKDTETGIVWVKKLPMVCEIVSGGQYDNLPEAIAAVGEGETIRLLADINFEKSVNIYGALPVSGKKFTLNFDGHRLSIVNPEGMGIDLSNKTQLEITGGGELKVNAKLAGLYLSGSQFTSDNTVNVMLESSRNAAISTGTSSTVNILKGEAKGGIYATSNNTITLGGAVIVDPGESGSGSGVYFSGTGNTVSVAAIDVRSGSTYNSGYGIYMREGGTVTVGSLEIPGNVIGRSSGISTYQGSSRAYVTVYGDVEGGSHGIFSYDDAEIKVFGNVKSTSTNNNMWGVKSSAGITTSQSNLIEIDGNVQGPNGLYIYGASGLAKVRGNVTATGTASNCKGVEAANGSAEIGGNVTAPSGIGAEADTNGQITIDGELSGKTFARVKSTTKTAADKTIPTTKEGYHTYSKDSSVVWVKEEAIVTKYTLTVEKGSGDGSYAPTTEVNIQADPAPEGKVFDHWLSDGGSFADANSPNTTFTMPAKAVTVTATYKDKEVPQVVYTITASADSGGTISPSGDINVNENDSKTFTITAKDGYRIASVMVDGIDQGAISTYTFDNIIANHTISASFSYVRKGGGGSSSSDSTYIFKVKLLDSEGNVIEDIQIQKDKGTGIVSLVCDSATLNTAFNKAKPDPKGVKKVIIAIDEIDGAKSYKIVLPKSFLALGDENKIIEIKTSVGTIRVPGNIFAKAVETEERNFTLIISPADKSKLDGKIRAQIGDRPFVEMTCEENGKQCLLKNEGVPVTVAIPYQPTFEELRAPEHIVVWQIDERGHGIPIPNGRYDSATGTVVFRIQELGQYAVINVHKTFADLNSVEWARIPIEIMASKGIINGTGANTFSPTLMISRADYLALLIKTLELTANFEENFDDVGRETYYYEVVGIAKELGIATAIENNKFHPEVNISRQDMMVMTAIALERFGKVKATTDSSILDKFIDKEDIADYALGSLATLVKEGLIAGSGNKLLPRDHATRAEAAAFLYRIYNLYQ